MTTEHGPSDAAHSPEPAPAPPPADAAGPVPPQVDRAPEESVAPADGLWERGLRAAFGAASRPGDPPIPAADGAMSGRPTVSAHVSGTSGGDAGTPAPALVAGEGGRVTTRGGEYEIMGEIARGGFGVVLRALDVRLGREVALKRLYRQRGTDPAAHARFLAEARIGGQLQHPGVVPVYELAEDQCGRPFIAMKCVRGRTLAELLRERRDPGDRRHEFLRILEQVCQAMAYAHALGVIHRDLKPANVMVGAFGEVQVLDWGLAKVLATPAARSNAPHPAAAAAAGGAEPDADARGIESLATIGTDDAYRSTPGFPMGTPAYMAPEAARGDSTAIDERSDVFSLGAMLCEILTGIGPYASAHGREAIRLAAAGDLGAALERLRRCGAPVGPRVSTGEETKVVAGKGSVRGAAPVGPAGPASELEPVAALALDCLQVEPAGRPPHAGAVAARLAAYFAGAEERARRAEVAAAEERMRAAGERRARRLVVGLAVALLLLVVGVGGYLAQRAEERRRAEAEVDLVLKEAEDRAGRGDWEEAERAVGRAAALVRAAVVSQATHRRIQLLIETYAAKHHVARLLDAILAIRLEGGTTPREAGRRYAEAFRDFGIDLDAPAPETARRIQTHGEATATRLVLALDDWAARIPQGAPDLGARWPRLVAAAAEADPDPWRKRLRRAMLASDRDDLEELARGLGTETPPPESFLLLAQALHRFAPDSPRETEVLLEGYRRYPGDFWINQTLGRRSLAPHDRPTGMTWDLAERHARIALALRPLDPDVAALLGTVLRLRIATPQRRRSDEEESLRLLRAALDRTTGAVAADCLRAAILDAEGNTAEARRLAEQVSAAEPHLPLHLRALVEMVLR